MKRSLEKTNYLRMKDIILMIMTALLLSCNGEMERVLKDDYPEENTSYDKGHVLFIIIDGASGKAVQTAYNTRRAQNIKEMTKRAVYTFEGLADAKSVDEEFSNQHGWSNLMTGKTLTGRDVPTFLTLAGNDLTSSLYAASQDFYDTFGNDATKKLYAADDASVKDKVIAELSNATDKPSDLIIAELKGVYEAGVKNGFVQDNGLPAETLVDALGVIDGYIGHIISALHSRPNYDKENWLVIVTSNYGGDIANADPDTYYESQDRQLFSMIYSDGFESVLLQKPAEGSLSYKFFTPQYSGALDEFATVSDPTLFDMERYGSYTIQFFYYCLVPTGNSNNTSLISKKENQNATPGWFLRRRYYRFIAKFRSSTYYTLENSADNIQGGKWHVITCTVAYNEQTDQREIKFFLDGWLDTYGGTAAKQASSNDITNPTVPLTIGPISGTTAENRAFYITNLQFYNVALPDDYIAKNYGKDKFDQLGESFEYWDNLTGYWPCDREDDYRQSVLKDYSKYGSVNGGENAGRSDFHLSNDDFTWVMGDVNEENLSPTPDAGYYRQVINAVDIPYAIMMWLGCHVSLEWGLEGTGRAPVYSSTVQNNN